MAKFFQKDKDGGPESKVWAYWFVESKRVCTIAFLHFGDGGREVFHSHAFNAISWVLKGELTERAKVEDSSKEQVVVYRPSLKPIWTPRDRMHMVKSKGDTLVFTLRGPWWTFWREFDPKTGLSKLLTWGRKEASITQGLPDDCS